MRELSTGLGGGAAQSLNEGARDAAPALRDLALASDASLGQQPTQDIQRLLRGTAKLNGALSEDEEALKGVVTNLGATAGALASEDEALAAAVPALRDVLRASRPALTALDATLPPLRALATEATPSVRRTEPLLDAALPFTRQLSALAGPTELRATTRALRVNTPPIDRLLRASVPLFEEGRAASRCTEKVLVPFVNQDFPDPDFPKNSGTVNAEADAVVRGAQRREPVRGRQPELLPRLAGAARHPGSPGAAQFADQPANAPARRAVRDPGAAEPGRARGQPRPDGRPESAQRLRPQALRRSPGRHPPPPDQARRRPHGRVVRPHPRAARQGAEEGAQAVRRAIKAYLPSFLAVAAVMLLGLGVGAYILSNQRLRFPLLEESPKKINAVLVNAQAVQPGQGQSVRVAGVTIGAIGRVRLEDGRALVTLEIEPKFKSLVKEDATALLRTKTGLKDMFVEVDPGHGKTLPAGGRIALSDTLPDVNVDEVLSVLDSDTRPYLQLLINGGGKGLEGRGEDLSKTLRQLGPLQRDTRRVSGALARRRANLRRLINRYGRLTEEVGASDRDLVRLVRASNQVFSAFADERGNLSSAVAQLPGTLRQTETTLNDVRDFSVRLGPALQALRPTVRQLDPATRALLPLAREGTPIVRDRLRPLARAAPARLNTLGAAAGDLATAGPDLTTSLAKANRLLNMAAYNPNGAEALDGMTFDQQRNRQEGYLYWAAWVSQIGGSLFGTADGQGVYRRFTGGGVNCGTLTGFSLPSEVTNLLGGAGLCTP